MSARRFVAPPASISRCRSLAVDRNIYIHVGNLYREMEDKAAWRCRPFETATTRHWHIKSIKLPSMAHVRSSANALHSSQSVAKASKGGEPPSTIQSTSSFLLHNFLRAVHQPKVWITFVAQAANSQRSVLLTRDEFAETYPITSSSAPLYSAYSSPVMASSSSS